MSHHKAVVDDIWREDLESAGLLPDQPKRINGKAAFDHSPNGFPSALRGKRILLATESLGPINGVSRTTSMLIDYLRQNGVEVAVVAPEIKSAIIQHKPEIHVDIRLKGYALPYNPDLTIAYPFKIDRIFERTFRPDLVYLASPASVGFQALLQLQSFQDGPPVLCNFQTDLASYGDIIFPSKMGKYAAWLLGLVQGYLFRDSSVHAVFFPSSGIREYLESVGVQRNKLIRLGRGVDTALFNPAHRDANYRRQLAPNGEIILIAVSRLAPEKGFEFLSRVVFRLASEELPFKLIIVGGNRNPSIESEVRKYFEPVIDSVVFTGFLTGPALARAYATADIFLHCSITETFGLVVLEAMASGLPVIARDQGGPSDIVRHGKTGYLTHADNLTDFVGKVRQLCEDDNMRTSFADSSRAIALETTWEKINNRAAQQMATTIRQHLDQSLSNRQQKESRPRNWCIRDGAHRKLVQSLLVHFKLAYTVLIICVFWTIAVVPLLVHGALVYWVRDNKSPLRIRPLGKR